MQRQILFLTSTSLTAYRYDGRALACMAHFTAVDGGLAAFDAYLKDAGQMPTHILTDLVEEDFRIDSLAHTHGRDRSALLARHMARLYRGTGYRHAHVLGRDPHNRRKDEVLFSGLLNPEFADLWLNVLAQNKVPVAGIHSLPLQSAELMKRVWDGRKDVLFVTHNRESGLRQSFFAQGQLRFSRLTPVPEELSNDGYAQFVHEEIGKTKRYLSNLHLLQRDVVLDVCMLSGGTRLGQLDSMRADEALTHYHLIDVADAAARVRYRGPRSDYQCDELFAFMLARRHTHNHYANEAQRFHYRMFRARQGLALLGLAVAVGGLLWAGMQAVDSLLYRREAVSTEQLLAVARQRNDEVAARLPQTDVAPEDMRLAVAAAAHLQQQRRDPHTLLAGVGQALAQQAGLELDQIDWFVSGDRAATAAVTSDDTEAGAPEYDENGNPIDSPADDATLRYQIGVVHGRVLPFDGNYGGAHQRIEELLARLRATRGVIVAEALELPLNTASSGRVLGSVGDTERVQEALFTLRIVMGDGHV